MKKIIFVLLLIFCDYTLAELPSLYKNSTQVKDNRLKSYQEGVKQIEHQKLLAEQQKPLSEKLSDSVRNMFKYDNPQECILDKMPEVQNDYAARTMAQYCIQNSNREFGEKRSDLFGPSNVRECFLKYASDTPSRIASKYIASACKTLYIP